MPKKPQIDVRLLSTLTHICAITILLSVSAKTEAAAPWPVWADSGMVVTSHPLASRIGRDILTAGGNAVDAAVATAFALGIVEGYSSGIGGGSFTLLHLADSWETLVIDGREKAPWNARPDMYIDKRTGEMIPELSTVGVLAAATPGHLKALTHLLDNYGTMSLGQVLEPSIALADTGFELSQTYVRVLDFHRDKLSRFESTFEILFHPDSTLLGLGERLIQRDLARTYRILAEEGDSAFYEGTIAHIFTQAMRRDKGLITAKDLEEYDVAIRQPVMGTYRGYSIYSMPPPSSGGVHLIQMLNMLERYDLAYLGHNSSETIHLMAEAMKRAFADRAVFMGDPDFVEVPVNGLVSKDYADSLSWGIARFRSKEVSGAGNPYLYDQHDDVFPAGKQTTHFSVIDQGGNMVAMTATINTGFGSGYVIPGTGIFLNNEMDDFSARPGVANYFGLVGAEANAIEPGKRPLSSMTPTLVFYEGAPAMVAGSPGGPRIITTVLQVMLNVIDHGMNIQEAVDAPRIHHQWLPDRIYLESGIPYDVIENLIIRGHDVMVGGTWSAAEAILIDLESGLIYGGTDSRVEGGAAGY